MPTIALLCATRRGYRFLERLIALVPEADLVVFSFPEDPWEPRFLEDIRALTQSAGGQFFETCHVGSPKWSEFWQTSTIDLMFAVSWRYMIPPRIYSRARLGAFVIHDSLLPEYRGFAPTVWAIVNGEERTGATLFEIAEGVDEGAIVAQQAVPISRDDTIAAVMEHVTEAYLSLLEQNLGNLLSGTAVRVPQDHALATYTCKRVPEDNLLDWRGSTEQIYNLIRASSAPYPGAFTYLEGKKVQIWAARRLSRAEKRYVGRVPGRVVEVWRDEGAVVLTGDGALLITDVQCEGDEIRCAAEVLSRLSYTLGR